MAKSSGYLKQDGESLWLCVVLKLKKILGSFDTKNRPMLGNSAFGISEILWNPKSLALESVIQLKESRIPPTIGVRNPSSTDKESGFQKYRLTMTNSQIDYQIVRLFDNDKGRSELIACA